MNSSFPHITNKQQIILSLLYRHRFLNRIHIQTFLNHKDKQPTVRWLKNLTEKNYIARIYDSTDFINKTKPAVYYLSLDGLRYLHTLDKYPAHELRKRYRESTRTQTFIEDSLFIADCCVQLNAKRDNGVRFTYETPVEYSDPTHSTHFLSGIKPTLYFVKYEGKQQSEYVLEVLSSTLPSYQLRRRMRNYFEFVIETDWREWGARCPTLLVICTDTAHLLQTKRYLRRLLELRDGSVSIRLTTRDKVTTLDITESIWEEV